MKVSTQGKLRQLKQLLRELKSCVIAYSGGLDSMFLVKVAYDVLGKNALAVTAASSMFPRRELQDAKRFAKAIGISHVVIHFEELDISRFSENPPNRCYYCKKELFRKIIQIAKNRGFDVVCDGSNADDTGDYRPGEKAKNELKVRSPLREVGLTKREIRVLSQSMGLKSYDKPAFACLASRFPYGVKITKKKLAQVESAEDFLFGLGIRQCRVRYHEHIVRIEIPEADLPVVLRNSKRIIKRFKELSFTYITLDLEGYRTGSMNEVLVE